MPHFKTEDLKHLSFTDKVVKALKEIPTNKLIVLDNINHKVEGYIGVIYQDLENDIYFALKEVISKISTYEKIILVYPEKAIYTYPRRILYGFKKFFLEFERDFDVIDKIYDNIIIKKGDLFIKIEEGDLVGLINQISFG